MQRFLNFKNNSHILDGSRLLMGTSGASDLLLENLNATIAKKDARPLFICNFLERLDEAWTERLQALEGFSFDETIFKDEAFATGFEQLSVYFIFRHLTEAMWNGDYEKRVHFALVSVYMIGALWANCIETKGAITLEDMIEIVRLYSSEIEYSEENTEALMNLEF